MKTNMIKTNLNAHINQIEKTWSSRSFKTIDAKVEKDTQLRKLREELYPELFGQFRKKSHV